MWYEDKAINLKSEECDAAFDSRDSKLLLKLSEECRLLAENKDLHKMIQAKYYFDSFTCLSNYLEIEETSGKKREETIEKILYLCRTGLILLEEYRNEKSMDELEKAQYNGVYYTTIVNYCNILSHIGRLPKAMHTIRPIAAQGFGMAIGNLAMELYDYSKFDYDTGHQQVLLEKVCVLLKEAISYPNIHVHEMAKKRFQELLFSILGNEAIEEKIEKLPGAEFLNINKFDTKYDSLELMNSEEQDYKKWVSSKCLSLNTLNDVDYSLDISYDPIHLPNMLASLEEKHPRYHGLFNQIKQEYCSARYMIYDRIFNSKHHFSDAEVYLVNTLDYPVYSYNIEKVKSAYRTIYSLFDRIAFFLNEYFSLGIAKDRVSFGAVWRKNSRLHEIAASNYFLGALHWIKKDLYKNSVSEYKEYIDPILHRTYEIRNVMEHRYLKI